MNIDENSMQIILQASNAKSNAFDAMGYARNYDFRAAEQKMKEAKHNLLHAHKIQTALIQEDAGSRLGQIPLLLIHSQDHLMNAMAQKDLIEELIEMCKKQNEFEKKLAILEQRIKGEEVANE